MLPIKKHLGTSFLSLKVTWYTYTFFLLIRGSSCWNSKKKAEMSNSKRLFFSCRPLANECIFISYTNNSSTSFMCDVFIWSVALAIYLALIFLAETKMLPKWWKQKLSNNVNHTVGGQDFAKKKKGWRPRLIARVLFWARVGFGPHKLIDRLIL